MQSEQLWSFLLIFKYIWFYFLHSTANDGEKQTHSMHSHQICKHPTCKKNTFKLNTHTYMFPHTYIQIYMCMCVCVCLGSWLLNIAWKWVFILQIVASLNHVTLDVSHVISSGLKDFSACIFVYIWILQISNVSMMTHLRTSNVKIRIMNFYCQNIFKLNIFKYYAAQSSVNILLFKKHFQRKYHIYIYIYIYIYRGIIPLTFIAAKIYNAILHNRKDPKIENIFR